MAKKTIRRQLADQERLRMLGAWRYFRRKLFGKSKDRIAYLLGVSRGKVERWESTSSDRLPDIGDIVALAKAMRIKPEDLFAWIMRCWEFEERR